MSKPKGYNTWRNMKQRCLNPSNKDYDIYGGRGITICDEWLNSFDTFISDMGPKPSDMHSIDRVDTNGPYAPWNCRWATAEEQANNCRTNRLVTYLNREQTLALWCKELNLHYGKTLYRLNIGMSIEDSFTLPSKEPIRLTHDGMTLTLKEWSEHSGINLKTLISRLSAGMSIAKALTIAPNAIPKHNGMDIVALDQSINRVYIFNSAREAARELGLSNHKTIVSRVKAKDLTPTHGFIFAYNNKANAEILMGLVKG